MGIELVASIHNGEAMTVFPDDDQLDLLEQVCRRLPEAEAAEILGRPRDEFMTWIDAYLAVHRTGAQLHRDLRHEFTVRVLREVSLNKERSVVLPDPLLEEPEIPSQRPALPPPVLE